jgi:hypothetical protein
MENRHESLVEQERIISNHCPLSRVVLAALAQAVAAMEHFQPRSCIAASHLHEMRHSNSRQILLSCPFRKPPREVSAASRRKACISSKGTNGLRAISSINARQGKVKSPSPGKTSERGRWPDAEEVHFLLWITNSAAIDGSLWIADDTSQMHDACL